MHAMGALVEPDAHEDDINKIMEESSSEADEAIVSSFELCKRGHSEGMSTSGAHEQDPPKEVQHEKRQKVRQDPAPRMTVPSSSDAPAHRLLGKATRLIPVAQKPQAKPSIAV